jgi:hypothetical protein
MPCFFVRAGSSVRSLEYSDEMSCCQHLGGFFGPFSSRIRPAGKYSTLRKSSSYRTFKKFKGFCHEKICLKALKIKSVLFVYGLMVFNFLCCLV